MPKVAIPEDYLCPITHEVMMDPVSTADGHVYERAAIEKWLSYKTTSPVTNIPLSNKTLIPNHFAKKQIENYLSKINFCTKEQFFEYLKQGNLQQLQKVSYLENYLEATDTDNCTPLIIAARDNRTDILRWLIEEGVNIETQFKNGSTALSFAAQSGALDTLKILIEKKANLEPKSNLENDNHYTPLLWAISANRYEASKLLIESKASLIVKDDKGNSPLHLAAEKGYQELVKLLLDQGANRKIVNNEGKLPEQVARQAGNNQIATFILEYSQKLKLESKKAPEEIMRLKNVIQEQEKRIIYLEKQIKQLLQHLNLQDDSKSEKLDFRK